LESFGDPCPDECFEYNGDCWC